MKDFFKKIFSVANTEVSKDEKSNDEVVLFLNDLIGESIEIKESYSIKLSELEHYKTLKTKTSEFKKELIYLLIHYKNNDHSKKWNNQSYFVDDVFSKLSSLLVRSSDLNFNEDELLKLGLLLTARKKSYVHTSQWPFVPFISRLEKLIKATDLTPALEKSLNLIYKFISSGSYVYSEEIKVLNKIKLIKEGPKKFSVSNGDLLGRTILKTVDNTESNVQTHLVGLLNHFSKGTEKSKPALKWIKEADSFIQKIDDNPFLVKEMMDWIGVVIDLLKEIHKNKSYEFSFITDENLQLLRASIWASYLLNDDNLNQTIEEVGLWSFKKLSGYGAVSVKLGNSCIYSFSKLPYQDGVSRLTKFRMKIKYPSVQSLITKAIVRVAEVEGKTMDEIEELAVQDFNLDDDYKIIRNFDSYKGLLTIQDSSTVSLLWENDKGKTIKAVPKYVKDNFPEELKDLKKKLKDIQTNLSAQRARIEKIFLAKREWQFTEWHKLYIKNKLLAFFGTKLIWSFTLNDKTTNAILYDGKFVNPDGILDIDFDKTKVELWHPVLSSVNEVQSWRNWLIEKEIRQPFKQAHREIYILTDAEKTTNSYSNRFAGHIVRQHVFNALCRERGWTYQLQGQWDSYNIPSLYLPAWKYRVEFWVETDGVSDYANQNGIFDYLQTDQVRFYDENSQVDMEDVPVIVFSETLRDVDLFVGVTSIGADPNWRDGGPERFHGYWSNFSFGELATSGVERKLLLENLIPKLHIRDKCSFEGNFLVVTGKLRIYKIHMGSGNILMKPNDQYLCIVANRKQEQNVFLPFEGDSMLSTILSKAFMLANDDKIKDKTIISQINKH